MSQRQDRATTTRTPGKGETIAVAPPCAMVIFGAGGDLTKRLVMPALYNLVTAKRLPDGFRIVGVDHGRRTVEEWRQGLTDMMKQFVGSRDGEFQTDRLDQKAWQWLLDRMSYVQAEFEDADAYKRIGQHLDELDKS